MESIQKHFIINNETLKLLIETMHKNNITYDLVPLHQHWRNTAEWAIQTFKNHLLSSIATCHSDFSIREWDRILLQYKLKSNLLWDSRINPKFSSWSYLFGNHISNRVLLLPPDTKVIVHEKSSQRKTWDYHGVPSWYTELL